MPEEIITEETIIKGTPDGRTEAVVVKMKPVDVSEAPNPQVPDNSEVYDLSQAGSGDKPFSGPLVKGGPAEGEALKGLNVKQENRDATPSQSLKSPL